MEKEPQVRQRILSYPSSNGALDKHTYQADFKEMIIQVPPEGKSLMSAINYCIYNTNIWCIPTTEIATWWQVVIAAAAVFFAIRAINATNSTSQAALDRDKNVLNAKRAAFLAPLTNEIYATLVRTYQIKNLLNINDSKEACEHIFSILSLLELPCLERSVQIVEAFTSDEASLLTRCSLAISKCHNFVRGNPIEKLNDAQDRATITPSLHAICVDLENVFTDGLTVIAKASGILATPESAAVQANSNALLVARSKVAPT